ncbi:MAG: hypothetical protein J4G14_10725 [Dehalococcoidia bacterium]|nr:hypothetical protein [Dehalococcoidia bacterium]
MANLLAELVDALGETEQRLDVDVEGDEVSIRAVLEDHPTGVFRIMCALLLRKARLHTIAILRANESNNVHSLAVQMRPVLECAGQVVHFFHNLMIEPEYGERAFHSYINADYYRTVIRLSKGKVSHEQALTQMMEASGMSKGEIGKGSGLKQSDKVARLEGGKIWYDYMSEYFCHGKGEWRGHSWQGGVNSMNTVQDEYTFAGLMDYLINQVAVMNAYAELCPMSGEVAQGRVESALAQLQEVRAVTTELRDRARLAVGNQMWDSRNEQPRTG